MRSPFLHPLLAAAFPVIFLYAHNARVVVFGDVWLTLVVAVVPAAVAVLLLRWLHRAHRACAFLTLALLLFYSFGHAVRLAPQATRARLGMSGETVVATLALAVLALGAFALHRVRRRRLELTTTLNVLMTLLLSAQIVRLAYVALDSDRGERRARVSTPSTASTAVRPDIYFIVLDGYARHDVLREMYAHDNSVFLDSLREMGFQVLDQSRSNYCQTILSLASTLNLDYIPELVRIDRRSRDRRPAHRLIQDNTLFEALRTHGYSIVAFASGFEPTELHDVDHYLRPGRGLSEFQQIVMSTTPLPLVMRLGKTQYDLHRERLDFILSELRAHAVGQQPRFVFAHLVAPHPPFVVGALGEPVERQRPFDFGDGSHYYDMGGSHEEYVAQYRAQLTHVSARVLEALTELLEHAAVPPIIVLQSDHGPGSELDWWSLPRTNLRERFAILNALLLPGVDASLPPGLSPVNTFRLILNAYLGTDLEMLPDRSYYTVLTHPYHYFDVTDPERMPPWPNGLDLSAFGRRPASGP